jgi:branched-subunit amino acid transport protein
MSDAWILVAVLGAVNFAIKASGPLLAGRRELPRPVQRFIAASVAGLIAALIVTGTFGDGQALVVDARAGGLAAAAVAVLARAPMVVVLVVAAGATALLRAI